MKYFFQSVIPAAILLLLAFWAGTVKNPVLGLVGFLSFFTVSITILVEGKKQKSASHPSASTQSKES